MEPRIFRWVSELGLDEAGFILQPELISQLNQFSTQEMAATSLDYYENIQRSLSSESSTLCSSIFSVGNSMERAQRVNNNYKNEPGLFFVPDAAPLLLSFDQHQSVSDNIVIGGYHAKDHGTKRKKLGSETESKKMKICMKQPVHAHDHIIAERRRREKLSQRFIALAAVIPGLKKIDKASVLGDAIKHIKDLEERVKILDEKLVKKTVEIATMNMKPHDASNDCQSPISSVENNGSINVRSFDDQKLHSTHEMQVKISEKAVLVKVHCENHKGVLAMVISNIEELHLKINSISAVPFLGSTFIDITVAAQIDEEEGSSITVTDVVEKLNSGLSECR